MEREGILEHTCQMAEYFRSKLEWLKGRHAIIEEVRGVGLLLGLRLTIDGEPIVLKCMEQGFLINCVQGKILRFVPPLVITRAEIDALIGCLDGIFSGEGQKEPHA